MKVSVFYTKGTPGGRDMREKAEMQDQLTLQEIVDNYAVVYHEETCLRYMCTPEMLWQVFNDMADGVSNPLSTKEGQVKIKSLDVAHTSMSTGDMVAIDERIYRAASIGFEPVNL